MVVNTREKADSVTDEIFEHSFIYVPWASDGSTSDVSIAAAEAIATRRGLPLTVAALTLQSVPDELRNRATVTERAGSVKSGGVVLAYFPTYKLMSKIDHLSRSVVVLGEFHSDDHSGWAKSVGAYNLATGDVMSDGLNDKASAAVESLLFAGYKGWHDEIATREAMHALSELNEAGGYDRQVVLFRARRKRGEKGISRLYPILDHFEQSTGAGQQRR